jgi:hypothetical protein
MPSPIVVGVVLRDNDGAPLALAPVLAQLTGAPLALVTSYAYGAPPLFVVCERLASTRERAEHALEWPVTREAARTPSQAVRRGCRGPRDRSGTPRDCDRMPGTATSASRPERSSST